MPALQALLPSWQALDAGAPHVPLAAALQLSGASGAACVAITAHVGGALCALWPLRLDRVGPVRVARRLGGSLQIFDGPTIDAAWASAPEPWRGRLLDDGARLASVRRALVRCALRREGRIPEHRPAPHARWWRAPGIVGEAPMGARGPDAGRR